MHSSMHSFNALQNNLAAFGLDHRPFFKGQPQMTPYNSRFKVFMF